MPARVQAGDFHLWVLSFRDPRKYGSSILPELRNRNGSARGPRAGLGGSPKPSSHLLCPILGRGSLWDKIFGEPPKTARQRRALPKRLRRTRLRLRSSGLILMLLLGKAAEGRRRPSSPSSVAGLLRRTGVAVLRRVDTPRRWRVSRRPSNCAKRLGLRQSSGALWRKRNPAGFLHELDCANINMIRDNRPFDGGGAVLSSSSLGGPFFPEAMTGKGENFHFTRDTSIADSRPIAEGRIRAPPPKHEVAPTLERRIHPAGGKSRVGLPHKCGVPVAWSQVTPLHNPRHPQQCADRGVSQTHPWFNSFNGHCLWGTEFENSVESLSITKGQGCGAGRAAIGPACGGTCGGHFPGRRGEPGY